MRWNNLTDGWAPSFQTEGGSQKNECAARWRNHPGPQCLSNLRKGSLDSEHMEDSLLCVSELGLLTSVAS